MIKVNFKLVLLSRMKTERKKGLHEFTFVRMFDVMCDVVCDVICGISLLKRWRNFLDNF